MSRDEADPECRKLGREPIVREHRKRCPIVVGAPATRARVDEGFDQPILRCVDKAVETSEPRRSSVRCRHCLDGLAKLTAVEPFEIEVDAQHQREHEECKQREPGLSGHPAEPDEDRRVHEQIGFGVEIAAEGGDSTRGASELTVRVVEHRLRLQEKRGDDEVSLSDLNCSRDANDRARRDDGRRWHAEREQREHDEVRKRAVDELAENLEARPLLSRRCKHSGILPSMPLPHGWSEVDGALERVFLFDGFSGAVAFVNRVAELAESEDHHPDIAIRYNRVVLRWSTHSADAITERDRELAERSAELFD
jgi:4a-hydroxytetrahydrobiopterin dehydratase